MHPLIDCSYQQHSALTALDGRIKVLLVAGALTVNLAAASWRVSCGLALLAWLLTLFAGVRQKQFWRRLAIPLLLASVAFITQLFWIKSGDRVVFSGMAIHADALWSGLALASRILGGMAMILFFVLTTPLPELMRAARSFRCPPLLVELTLIIYRYIFLLLEETERIRTAQRARAGYSTFRYGLRSSSMLGGMLLLRTYDRAERSFEAMRCRGYRGALLAPTETGISPGNWRALGVGVAMLGGLYLIG
ncbi:MAG: cobalt ECF transporter T component CbiQ [Desulfuromonadales bacterium]|nr:cobalt ECF transporter T component CbiQ [Desulfuromonadales bacterium]